MIPIGDDKAQDTEDAARRYRGLDTWRTAEILLALWSSQSRAVAACLGALPALQRAVDGAVERLARATGRLVYVGAGSSGMVAALDALDLGATFDWPDERLAVFLAGGLDLQRGPDPTAEDDAAGGRARARAAGLGPSDVVLGLSASGGSAYTVAVIEEARQKGPVTVGIASRAGSPVMRAGGAPGAL